ncbi:hypothetical protein [Streptomyces sp. NPDC004330]|uniref:hypothetical protein n=1 Tax=Streptomyces sp. NPDC004330 TaxID=3364700 RepID=UPI0036913F96
MSAGCTGEPGPGSVDHQLDDAYTANLKKDERRVADDCGVHGPDGCIAAGLVPDTDGCLDTVTRRCRRYRQIHGHWGIGIAHSPGGWHLTLGPWCWTREPE